MQQQLVESGMLEKILNFVVTQGIWCLAFFLLCTFVMYVVLKQHNRIMKHFDFLEKNNKENTQLLQEIKVEQKESRSEIKEIRQCLQGGIKNVG